MRNWKKYYNDEYEIVKKALEEHLHRVPDKQDYGRTSLIKRLNSNIVDIYIDKELIKSELLIPEEL